MAEYETEEQQVEALKNWWKEYGTAIIAGAVLGIAALSGWRYWSWHQEEQAKEASDLFAGVQEAVAKSDGDTLQTQAEVLRKEYKSTPYSVLATLHEAKVQAENGSIAEAEKSLRWVIENSSQEDIQDIARIRLARVLVADNKLDQAAETIDRDLPGAYASLVNEIRGDIFFAKGETEQAKQAYDQALESAGASNVEFLQMKRNDLGS